MGSEGQGTEQAKDKEGYEEFRDGGKRDRRTRGKGRKVHKTRINDVKQYGPSVRRHKANTTTVK